MPIELPRFVTVLETHAEFRPVGSVTFEQVTSLVAETVVWAREQRINKLLVVSTELTGFTAPCLGERYFFAQQLAEAARRAVRVAVVTRPDMIDPQRFGTTVARNRGASAEIFDTEAEAMNWLLDNEPTP